MSRRNSLAALLLLFSAAATAQDLARYEAAEPHMGTLFRITLYAGNAGDAQAGFQAAFSRIRELDDALSDYKPDNELMRVCRSAYRKPVPVSADLFTVLARAQKLARQTGGAFDVTAGPVIRVWRDARRQRALPDSGRLREAREHSGYRFLRLDESARTVELMRPDMQLDLGAIAKGYAADQALAALRALGIRRALVAASGDLAIADAPPGKAGWRVGIDLPNAPAGDFSRVEELRHAGVSTSGDTEQYAEIGGVRYSHIVDPLKGQSLTRRVGASVVASSGMESDSLSTALCVIAARSGIDAAIEFARKQPGVSARIVLRTDTGWETRSQP